MARQPQGQTRTAILDATLGLLIDHRDPALVTIDAVVQAVGCTPPTLYYYFPTKRHLLVEACAREYAAFAAALAAATPSSDDPMVDLTALGRAYVAWARAHPALYQLLFMTRLDLADPAPASTGEPAAMPDLAEVPGLGNLYRLLARANRGALDIPDLTEATLSFWALVHGFASLAVTSPDIPDTLLDAGLARAERGLVATYQTTPSRARSRSPRSASRPRR